METGPAGQPADGGPEPSIGRIPALDGVRAIGIILVLFLHGGFGWAGGGFFGVDVFFVLSGFLITGLLISEFRQNLHIGLKRFWGHRVRRLVPALLAMLAGVAIYGVFFAPADTVGQLRSDAVATLLYGNNWHLISGGTGYFSDLNTPRPLLHTWSLSIEEQFYLVWPLVVLAVLHWTRSLRVLLTMTVVGALASAIAMAYLFHAGSGESRAYYGTDTRAQALLIGAALAIVLAHPIARRGGHAVQSERTTSLVRSFQLTRLARGTLVALGGIGLAVVAWMSVTDNSATAWIYRGGFALIALATAAVVACVALVPSSPWARALSLRPVRYVGAISYGLYLYHLPIFVFLDNARTGLVGWPLFVLRGAVSFAVAAISFHFLEMPIRRGRSGGGGHGRPPRWPSEGPRSSCWRRPQVLLRGSAPIVSAARSPLPGRRTPATRTTPPTPRWYQPGPAVRSVRCWLGTRRPASSDSGWARSQRTTTFTMPATASSDAGSCMARPCSTAPSCKGTRVREEGRRQSRAPPSSRGGR